MNRSNLFNDLKKLIDYIEDHLETQLTLDQLAAQINISKFHLTRLFKIMCHQNLMSYVRSRKLAQSLRALVYTEERIIDIALRLGFEYEQSYIRAFKNEFGMPPNQYRRSQKSVSFVKKISLEDVLCTEDGFWLKPEIKMLKSFEIAGKRHLLTQENVHTEWNGFITGFWNQHIEPYRAQLFPESLKVASKTDSPSPYDFWGVAYRNTAHSTDFHFLCGLDKTTFSPLPESFETIRIQSGEFAQFHYIGHHGLEEFKLDRLNVFYERLFRQWRIELGYPCHMNLNLILDWIPEQYVSETYCEYYVLIPILRNNERPAVVSLIY